MCVGGGGGGSSSFREAVTFFGGGGRYFREVVWGAVTFGRPLLYSRTFFTEQMIFFTDHSTQSKFLLTRYVKTGCIRVSVEIPWRR